MGFRRNRLGLRLWWVGIASVCSAASAPSKVRYVKLAALNGPMHLEQALDDHQTIYVSCPSSNSIIAFSPEPSTGRLAFVQSLSDSASPDIYLSGVRATTVSPDGEHLYSVSESESTLMVFHRNPSTGVITFTEEYHKDSVNNDIFLSSPVSLVASLDQSHLYVSAAGGMVMDQSRSAVTCFQWDEKLSESVAVSRVYNGDAGVLGMERSYWVIESPDSKNIYVTSETGVVTFTKEDLTGRLSYLNHMPPLEDGVVPAKIMPREVVVSPDGRHVYAAVMAESHIRVSEKCPPPPFAEG
jgi:6-phosphogluconolactonase (cycloisomerase 2 family)